MLEIVLALIVVTIIILSMLAIIRGLRRMPMTDRDPDPQNPILTRVRSASPPAGDNAAEASATELRDLAERETKILSIRAHHARHLGDIARFDQLQAEVRDRRQAA